MHVVTAVDMQRDRQRDLLLHLLKMAARTLSILNEHQNVLSCVALLCELRVFWWTLCCCGACQCGVHCRTYEKSQNSLSFGESFVWLREYVFPLTFPNQTSKPASARTKPKLSLARLTTQSAAEHSRPCCRNTTGRGPAARKSRRVYVENESYTSWPKPPPSSPSWKSSSTLVLYVCCVYMYVCVQFQLPFDPLAYTNGKLCVRNDKSTTKMRHYFKQRCRATIQLPARWTDI